MSQPPRPLFFDARNMTSETNQFVCWLDIMGSRNIMSRSLSVAANFVMKLHVACLESGFPENVRLYPMNDGVYICTSQLEDMLPYLKRVFVRLATSFNEEEHPLYRFLVKGGLSYGPVVSGDDCLNCSQVLANNPDYCAGILLGIAMSQSFNKEKDAPPFGLIMDDSVRAFGRMGPQSRPISGLYWRWWSWHQTDEDTELVSRLRGELKKYYNWCAKHASTIGYNSGRMSEHRSLVEEYFSDEREWDIQNAVTRDP